MAICLSVCAAGFMFGCGTTVNSYSLVAPDGAPIAALANMWGETLDDVTLDYRITAEENINAEFAKGTEFIVAPINLGANIHNAAQADKTKYDYKLMNVTSWGVLYIVTTESEYISEADALNAESFLKQFDGKSITTIGRQAIPGKTVEYLLNEVGAEGATLEPSNASTIQSRIANGDKFTAVLGEPAITALKRTLGNDDNKDKNINLRVLCSVSNVYYEITGNEFPMAGMFVRADIAESDAKAVESINARVAESVDSFNADPEAAGNKASAAGSTLKGAVLKDAASKMNMRFKNSADSATAVTSLLANIGITADESFYL